MSEFLFINKNKRVPTIVKVIVDELARLFNSIETSLNKNSRE